MFSLSTLGRVASFQSISFSHEHRNSNFEPHKLAKYASSEDVGRHLWLGTPYDVLNVPMNIIREYSNASFPEKKIWRLLGPL